MRAAREALLAGLALLALSLLFYKLRILDPGVDPDVVLANVDLYNSHYPMAWFGFNALRSGDFPLWNPHQFCGEPFFANYYAGLLYPLNAVYLLFDVAVAMEISLVVHMLLAGLATFGLIRHLGLSRLAGLCAALTFCWSGWLFFSINQPRIFSALAWMPLTVLLLDRVLRGARGGWLLLTLAVALQLLIGALEIVVHTFYVGGLFVAFRLGELAWGSDWRLASARLGVLAGATALGVALCAVQLLPALEYVQLSSRAMGGLGLAQTLYKGAIPPWQFASYAAETTGWVTVGALPLVAAVLSAGLRGQRLVWLFAVTAAVLSATLVFGGAVYRVFYELPLGDLFRRPYKFLDVWAFAQAVLAGLAVARLEAWSDIARRQLWQHPAWLAALVCVALELAFLQFLAARNLHLIALLALLLVFGAVAGPGRRRAAVVALVAAHAASLFFGSVNTLMRPVQKPGTFASQRDLLESLKDQPGRPRVYLSPHLWFVPGLTLKQGMLSGIDVVNDYEPLAAARYADFFGFRSSWNSPDGIFQGRFRILPDTRWRILDLTSTRNFVMRRGEAGASFMASQSGPADPRFRLLSGGEIQVFEKSQTLPRALFVSRARVVDEPQAILETLDDPGFDPRLEVVLEAPVEPPLADAEAGAARGEAEITSYEAERVVVAVDTPREGFLVLNDLHYPGWKAFIDGIEHPVWRANFLFRAVRVAAGRSEVTFSYQPASFRIGLITSAGVALFLLASLTASLTGLRGRRARPEQPPTAETARA